MRLPSQYVTPPRPLAPYPRAFHSKIRQIEARERLRSFEDVTRQIRHVESQGSAPELSLGASLLELGDVWYRTVASTVLRVANVGRGWVIFVGSLKKRPIDSMIVVTMLLFLHELLLWWRVFCPLLFCIKAENCFWSFTIWSYIYLCANKDKQPEKHTQESQPFCF